MFEYKLCYKTNKLKKKNKGKSRRTLCSQHQITVKPEWFYREMTPHVATIFKLCDDIRNESILFYE